VSLRDFNKIYKDSIDNPTSILIAIYTNTAIANNDLSSYTKVMVGLEAQQWRQTISKELNNFKIKDIYELVPRPKDRKIMFRK